MLYNSELYIYTLRKQFFWTHSVCFHNSSFWKTPIFDPFFAPPHNAPPQNVPPSYVPPSGVPPSNVSMSVPSNSSMSYWHQAFPSFTHWSSPPPFAAPSAVPSPPPTITPQYGNQWHSGMSPHHYEIVMLPSNVQKCYGCGAIFSERSRSAPFNLCIKHVGKRVIVGIIPTLTIIPVCLTLSEKIPYSLV